jgi:hypothetical protein
MLTRIRTNSPGVLDTVIRVLTQQGVELKKLSNNEVETKMAEGDIRIMLQSKLDESKFNYEDDFVLVNGGSVWSKTAIINELSMIKKVKSTRGISGYFYKFMFLNFAKDPTDTRVDMRRWMVEHPSFETVMELIRNAEVLSWKTDVSEIVKEANEKYTECTA